MIKIKPGDTVFAICDGHQDPFRVDDVMWVLSAAYQSRIRAQIRCWETKPIMRLNRENGPLISLEDLYRRMYEDNR